MIFKRRAFPQDPAAPALELRSVTKQWRRASKPILHDVSLELPRGTLTWIEGANGAGKTTLLRIVAGLVDPESGTVAVEGLDPERDRREYQRRLAFLPAASVGLYARLTVAHHLDYWAGLSMIPFAIRPQAIAKVTRQFRLEELAGQRVDRLSMGQRQRVRLAMTFLPHPSVLLLDEPRNSLDLEGTEMLADAIAEANGEERTVIWCSPTGEDTRLDVDFRFLITEGKLEAVEPAAVG